MEVHAVLFDLDGTLLDTLEDIANSMNAALEKFGFPTHPVEKYKQFVGWGVGELARRSLPDGFFDEARVKNLSVLMGDEYSSRWGDATRPYPGVKRMLDGLTVAGLPLAILSNKPDSFTQLLCRRFLNAWNFEIILGASDQFPRKPDPTAALEIAANMKVEPGNFIYLGDSGTDMMTAVAAGMYPAGALWGFRDAGELQESGARVLLKRPEDMLAVIRT
jgi:phosphoglycolate phosphatase